jgi:hypothetical protein
MKKLAGFLAACLLVLIGSQNLVLSQTCPVETQGHQPDYPYANLWCPAKYFTPGRQGHTIKYIVIHTLLGSLQGGINCFYDPGKWCRDPRTKKPREVSAHYLIGKDGSITQMVHEGDTAWHAGNWQYNLESIGIEHEGFVEDPNWATEEMYQASARLVRYLVDKYGIPLENIIGHNQVPDPEEPGKYGGKENHYDPCNHPSWASTGGRCNNQYWKWDYFMQLVRGESPTPPPLDSDNDGIPDSQDRCPYQAGPGWNGGCPPAPVTDSDNDGVPDGQDACPYEPGPSWNNGCPEVPRPTNQPPIARFIFSPANPSIDQPVRFDASSSFDPDPGDYITEYRWDFNDDRIFDADGPIAYHTFSFSASYQVTLMVVDSRGAASFQHQVISVSGSTPPPPDTGPPPPPPPPLEDDSDQDGIPDSQDRCPYQAGPDWNDGCPVPPSSPPPPPPPLEDDSDHDGIPDSQDRCPYEAGPSSNGGCLPAPVTDSDNDGIPDSQDQCPYQAGPSWNGGCPEDTEPSPPPLPPVADSDNDGIPDGQDRCPYQAGPGWNDGCPVSSPPPPSSGSKTIEAALDTNGNGILDDDEILRALQYWSSGEEVPGTDGHTIDDAKMLELLDIWASRRLISSASAQSRSIQIGRAESLTVREIKLSPNPVKSTHLATFRAEGSGIAGLKVEVFNLEGMKVSEEETSGNTLRFYAVDNKGRPLANGVYLYVVRVRGFDGREYVSEVRKLVIMR